MADKITQQLLDSLTRAAAHPGGLLLYATKTEPGLFPTTAVAKSCAQKCLADGFIRIVGTEDAKGKPPRELYGLTDAGWEYLLAQVNPKQVLEDFVRVLEDRRGEVGELLTTARQMAESLQGLKEAVARVLPVVSATRIPVDSRQAVGFAPVEVSATRATAEINSAARHEAAVAVLDATSEVDLAPMILSRLADWSEATDCPLPELYRSLSLLDAPPTIGQFHDCLRELAADGAISLPAWTGPLYAMPEPAYALMNGHGIAYYASLRG